MDTVRKWWGLAALVPSLAMVFLDQSVVPVALPTIQKELGSGGVALEWVVNAYLLSTAALVLVGGKAVDLIGNRRAFLLGIILFAFSSLCCGSSEGVLWLIGARTLQGVGAALLFPASSVLLMSLFPPHQRGKATGINVSISSLFLILGPLVGGYFTQEFSWRWIFWINIPIALLGVLLALLFIPKSHPQKGKIDLWGALLFTAGASLSVIAIMQGRDWGWTSFRILSLSGAFLVSVFLFLWREKHSPHPFLDLTLFKHPIFKAVNITVFSAQFIVMITVFRAIFFQTYLDWSPEKAGFISFISTIPVLFISPIGGFLSDKFSPKLPIALGFVCLIFSFFWVPLFISSSLWVLLIGLLAFSFGIPLILTPSYSAAMGSIPAGKAGIGFGTIATIRALGGTIGVAMIGSAIDYIATFFLRQTGDEKFSSYEGFFYTHIAIAFLLIIALAFVFVLFHRKSAHHLPDAPAEGWD